MCLNCVLLTSVNPYCTATQSINSLTLQYRVHQNILKCVLLTTHSYPAIQGPSEYSELCTAHFSLTLQYTAHQNNLNCVLLTHPAILQLNERMLRIRNKMLQMCIKCHKSARKCYKSASNFAEQSQKATDLHQMPQMRLKMPRIRHKLQRIRKISYESASKYLEYTPKNPGVAQPRPQLVMP